MTSVDDYSDLLELGIDIDETDSLTAKFNKCAKHLQSLASSLDSETLLKCYGFYKQGLEGNCNVPKPGWYDMKGKAKWESWSKLQDMPQDEAKLKYIETVSALSPNFQLDKAEDKDESWVKVSTMHREQFKGQRNISDYIRDGDTSKIKEFLVDNKTGLNDLDENGMGIIHYAADIGNLQVLQLIIENGGVDINLQDSEGQTALHYAACCGHVDCIKCLLSGGARQNVLDNDGSSPKDVANDDAVKELFQ